MTSFAECQGFFQHCSQLLIIHLNAQLVLATCCVLTVDIDSQTWFINLQVTNRKKCLVASGPAPHQIESPRPENGVCGGATKEPHLVHCQASQELVLESYNHTRSSENRPEVPPSVAGVGVSQSLSALQSRGKSFKL